jgi:hypothetical protein
MKSPTLGIVALGLCTTAAFAQSSAKFKTFDAPSGDAVPTPSDNENVIRGRHSGTAGRPRGERRGARGVDRVCGSDAGEGWVRVGAACYTANQIRNYGKERSNA